MAVQTLAGTSSLISVGVGAGDVAVLYTVGRRLGNWLTASLGDVDFLAMLEEDEMNILRRRGIIDPIAFQRRWSRTIRLMENGRPQRVEGTAVEKLLEDSSRFTAIMICIIAVLDEFATASTLRMILKTLFQRLMPNTEIIESLPVSQLRNRINAWRSAAAVREMNLYCRRIRESMIQQGFVLQGNLPEEEAHEVMDLLNWLLAGETDVKHTSSSDVAGIAYCLTQLSFEILTIENFADFPQQETTCRLIYSNAPLYSFPPKRGSGYVDTPKLALKREPSTTVSLTQLDETFSTFPIEPGLANRCRAAWQDGAKAGKGIYVQVSSTHSATENADVCYEFGMRNWKSQLDTRRAPSMIQRISEALAFFVTVDFLEGLSLCLQRESDQTLSFLHELFTGASPQIKSVQFQKPEYLAAFTVCQAFVMGYYYDVFLKLVDSSMLEVKTVSGKWGYRSGTFFSATCRLYSDFARSTPGGQTVLLVPREEVLAVLACLCADHDGLLLDKPRNPFPSKKRIGVVGKRMLLTNSLIRSCVSLTYISKFVILDTDAGGIPRDAEGWVTHSTPTPMKTWEDHHPPTIQDDVKLSGPPEDFTRHIEPDWDSVPKKVLLCIRYKGRRVGSVDPAKADAVFSRLYGSSSQTSPEPSQPLRSDMKLNLMGPAYECSFGDFIYSNRLVTPGRGDTTIPVIVHSMGSPCMRYAVAAWYSDYCKVAFIEDSMKEAFEKAQDVHWRPVIKEVVALIG